MPGRGAIVSFTRSVALELADSGVTINSVAPSATRTPILADVPDGRMEAIRREPERRRRVPVVRFFT